MPDPQRVINTVTRAAELFRSTPGRRGMVVELPESADDVLVAGDLHGNLAHFQVLLDRARLDRNPRRHLVLQEIVHGTSLYSDGSCKSHQLVDLVSALKCQYPERVHLILGNHELSELLDKPILKAGARTNDLFRQGIAVAYGARQSDVYAAYQALFRNLPLGVRSSNHVFLCHSHPEADEFDDGFDAGIFDATEFAELATHRQSSLYSLVWGRDAEEATSRRFAELVRANLLITGHMPCPNGFDQPNPLRLILDCSRFPACYCLFPNRAPIAMADLVRCVQSL